MAYMTVQWLKLQGQRNRRWFPVVVDLEVKLVESKRDGQDEVGASVWIKKDGTDPISASTGLHHLELTNADLRQHLCTLTDAAPADVRLEAALRTIERLDDSGFRQFLSAVQSKREREPLASVTPIA